MASTKASEPLEPLPSGMLTAMFTDIVDSTRLKGLMAADTEGRRDTIFRSAVKEPHDKRVLGCVRSSGGRKVKSTGDGYLFAFTDAEEAVLCALAIQHSLGADPIVTPLGPLQLRIGLHTGMARPGDEDYTGSTMDKAARIQTQAEPGEVLLSQQTKTLVAQLRLRRDAPGGVEGARVRASVPGRS